MKLPEWANVDLAKSNDILTVLLAIIGVLGFFIQTPYNVYYGAGVFVFYIISLLTLRYVREKRVERARSQSADLLNATKLNISKTKQVEDSFHLVDTVNVIKKGSGKDVLISKRTIGLTDEVREYPLRTKQPKILHVAFESTKPFSIAFLDKWHRDRMNLKSTYLFEPAAFKAADIPINNSGGKQIFLLMWSTDGNDNPLVTFEIWAE